jgi:hypothetical protein
MLFPFPCSSGATLASAEPACATRAHLFGGQIIKITHIKIYPVSEPFQLAIMSGTRTLVFLDGDRIEKISQESCMHGVLNEILFKTFS